MIEVPTNQEEIQNFTRKYNKYDFIVKLSLENIFEKVARKKYLLRIPPSTGTYNNKNAIVFFSFFNIFSKFFSIMFLTNYM